MTERDLQTIKVPLDEFVREVAREAAREVAREAARLAANEAARIASEMLVEKHERECLARQNAPRAIFWAGVAMGSGLLGGLGGAVLTKLW